MVGPASAKVWSSRESLVGRGHLKLKATKSGFSLFLAESQEG